MSQTSPKPQLRTALIRFLCGILLLCLSVALVFYHSQKNQKLYEVTVVQPTCTDNGYSLYTNKETGATDIRKIVPAVGHQYGAWTLLREADAVDCGIEERICDVCEDTDQRMTYPELGIARLSLYGSLEGIGKESEVPLTAVFCGGEENFECYATLKLQGHASLVYDKKNYTLKLFDDENHNQKNKLTFSHWNPEHKYILKANYLDVTQCRNLVCADIWADVVQSRDGVQKELKRLSNYGAVDGFPVVIYLNDEFHGLYTMNLHKDDDLFGMEDGFEQAVMILNKANGQEAFFRGTSDFTENSDWEVEFCGTADQIWAKEKLNELITFVGSSTDDAFRSELSRYLDVEAAIDYLLAMYALGIVNNGAEDLILVTYGTDQPWIPSMYDMEDAFGLYADGGGYHEPDDWLPTVTGGSWDSATGSLLWDRLLQNFEPEIAARYAQLRESILDPEELESRVTEFVDQIPDAVYAKEAEINGTQLCGEAQVQQITNYLRQRIACLDEIFLKKEG